MLDKVATMGVETVRLPGALSERVDRAAVALGLRRPDVLRSALAAGLALLAGPEVQGNGTKAEEAGYAHGNAAG